MRKKKVIKSSLSPFFPRVILSGTTSGVGKTTIALGIMLLLRKRKLTVQPFKTGPDYIDPTLHSEVCGRISSNLDSWLLSKDVILELFQRRAKTAGISVIEGVMGLYDGLKDSQEGSTAHLAKILKCPVILILNAQSLSRSAAAVVLGYKNFDRNLNISGVILNNVGSSTHYQYVKSAIENKTKIPVLGFLPKDANLKLPERHLGLVPAQEKKLLNTFKRKLLNLIEKNIDVKKIIKISKKAKPLPKINKIFERISSKKNNQQIIIALARDKAFNFYYQDNLDILKALGAKLIEFSPLKSKMLPKGINGLYIGGGFPELFAKELSKNTSLKQDIFQQAQNGLPIYAECGGLMYLVDKLINFARRQFPMVGIFKCSVKIANKRQALGYVKIKTINDNILSKKGDTNRAHIFHWSYIDNFPKNTRFAYRIEKNGTKKCGIRNTECGIKKNNSAIYNLHSTIEYDGLIEKNVLASYAHLHFASNVSFAKNFVKNCEKYSMGITKHQETITK